MVEEVSRDVEAVYRREGVWVEDVNLLFVNYFPPEPSPTACVGTNVPFLTCCSCWSMKVGTCDSAETSVPVEQNTPDDCSLNL